MTQRTLSFPINGKHCAGCEAVISTAVKELPGIKCLGNPGHRPLHYFPFKTQTPSQSELSRLKAYNKATSLKKLEWLGEIQVLFWGFN